MKMLAFNAWLCAYGVIYRVGARDTAIGQYVVDRAAAASPWRFRS